MWKWLTHPNIVPLLGITLSPLQLVSVWMPGGDLRGYIQKNPGVDRLELVCDPIIVPVSRSFPSPAARRRQRPLLPSLLQCDSWGPQGGM